MIHPWKIATAAITVVGVTAVATGATTAYFMRPASDSAAWPAPAAAQMVPPAPPAPPVVRPAVAAVPARPAPRVVQPAVATDCVSTGDRAWRIAKPGAIGGPATAGA